MSVSIVINQNNQTLRFLEEEDYSNAVASSMAALASLKASQTLQEPSSSQSRTQPDNGSLDQYILLNDHGEDETELESIRPMNKFIYKHGILLPPTASDVATMAPLLIFNTALAHHLASEASGSPTKDLQKAKHLYEIAYKSQETTAQNTLFRFATVNNIAVIDRELGNIEQSNHQIDQLISALMVLVDQQRGAELRQLRWFLVNLPRTITAASAA